jgi:hypothetical protein
MIQFESKVVSNVLTSRIISADQRTLWLYQENLGPVPSVQAALIEINGVTFESSYPPILLQQIQEIADAPEGRLVQILAYELPSAVSGPALVAERRGLETAFQAMQMAYSPERRSETPRRARAVAGQKTFQTEDYLMSETGGYVVKTQHRYTVFSHNALRDFDPAKYEEPSDDGKGTPRQGARLDDPHVISRDIDLSKYARAPQAGSHTRPRVEPLDDEHIGDDCFGMCGAGCSGFFGCGFEGWSHEWIGQPTVTEWDSCECSRKVDGGECGEPFSAHVTDLSGDAIHTIRGKSAVGCILHDACCRDPLNFLGCLNPACYGIGLEALVECAVAGWPVSWSYVGPHFERHSYIGSPMEWCSCEPCPTTERP